MDNGPHRLRIVVLFRSIRGSLAGGGSDIGQCTLLASSATALTERHQNQRNGNGYYPGSLTDWSSICEELAAAELVSFH